MKLIPLIHARLDAGYNTQQEFADALGLHRAQVCRYENLAFKKGPNIRTVVKIAKVVGVETEEVMSWFERKYKY